MASSANLHEAQIAARSRMYVRSAREAYERANARTRGAPELPAYPGDGSTVCLTNCACHWELEPVEDEATGEIVEWEAYWTLGMTEHCPDCLERAEMWNPLRIPA